MMDAPNGMFNPDGPVSGEALRKIAHATLRAKTVRGSEILPHAENLPSVSKNQLLYLFKRTDAKICPPAWGGIDTPEPITRLDAARFLAEVALLSDGDVDKWPEPRARTPLSRAELNPQLSVTLRVLAQRNLIGADESDYWLEHATEGGQCDGARVAALVQKAVAARHPEVTPETLWDFAQQEGFVGSAEYWRKNAVPGGKCRGEYVATVLRNLAQKTTPR